MRSIGTLPAIVVACGALLFAAGCGGGSSSGTSTTQTSTIASSGSNVVSISVNPGPEGDYGNGAFASVTVCVPGSTSNCQTIDDILVDTGSYGLRILSSALTVSLPQQTSSGADVAECVPFLDGYTWGPVETADIQISGEKASSVPIQVLNDSAYPLPSDAACTSYGSSQDTIEALAANGILGVGPFQQDCGPDCTVTGSANPGLYFACSSSSCSVTEESLAAQVQNPVPLFTTDNNGVIIELPSVTGGEPSLSGSMVFGIGTESNNALGSAVPYTIDDYGSFTTTFNGTTYSSSFIDSGSNALFFPDSSITVCPSPNNYFYCPSSPVSLSATNQGNIPSGTPNTSGSSGTVNFTVDNADTLFSNSADFVFNGLAGPVYGSNTTAYFDWGLPFFFGRNVFLAVAGASTPEGTGPYWAY